MSQKTVRTGAEVLALTEDLCIEDRYTTEEVAKKYDEWAEVYDQEMAVKGVEYTGPELMADIVSRLLSDKKDARILDFAAGTGLVGELLKNDGFTNMDALDGSSKMLERAAARNVYKKFFHVMVGLQPLDIEDSVYDAVICMGAFVTNHVPASCFSDIIRSTKPGGYCVLAIWEVSIDTYGPEIDRLVSEGKWIIKDKIIRENVYGSDVVHLFILQTSK